LFGKGETVRVLDLFSGLKGWSQPFIDRGHEVFTVDNDTQFNANLYIDIAQLQPSMVPFIPDIILASPPCTKFTVMQIGKNWYHDNTPKTTGAAEALGLVEATRKLISYYISQGTSYFILENPRAKLRKLSVVEDLERRTITYCQYGEERMKPTDLWGGFPKYFITREACKNGDPCHIRTPRGSHDVGTQMMVSKTSSSKGAKIPYELALDVCLAMEKELGEGEENGT